MANFRIYINEPHRVAITKMRKKRATNQHFTHANTKYIVSVYVHI